MTHAASRSAAKTARPFTACTRSTIADGSRSAPLDPGYWTSTPNTSSPGTSRANASYGSPTVTSIPSGAARVRTTAIVCGWQSASTKNLADFDFDTRRAIAIASAAAVASSSSEALASSMPVRSHDHLLEVEQGFEPALAHLGLVGGVGGVPGRVLQHVAQHHRRGDRAVVAHPDHAHEGAVPLRHRAKRFHRLALGQCGVEGERLVVSDRSGDGAAEKFVEGRDADDFEHCLDVPGGGSDVTRCEVIPHLDGIERAGCRSWDSGPHLWRCRAETMRFGASDCCRAACELRTRPNLAGSTGAGPSPQLSPIHGCGRRSGRIRRVERGQGARWNCRLLRKLALYWQVRLRALTRVRLANPSQACAASVSSTISHALTSRIGDKCGLASRGVFDRKPPRRGSGVSVQSSDSI